MLLPEINESIGAHTADQPMCNLTSKPVEDPGTTAKAWMARTVAFMDVLCDDARVFADVWDALVTFWELQA